ncbi:MAG: hypothetical protein JWM01_2541 [Arthrobacter sp.]|jgi:hypothetical protein|nr:hypothetical protein [Arthrobacter sp.]MCU1522016.1 hypothetical protein [Arthrobacter sp.]MCU1541594.1 hypothetical protein [Arthrobacter sp.]MCU1554287.1 hypothetical protein [Arthrobacter sp.]
MQSPRTLVESVEQNPALPSGLEERFAGYGVMGVPFSSGHILAMRHFAASSVGPGYTSVWIRDPAGVWTMHSTTDAESSCPRYFGSALGSASTGGISIRWHDGYSFSVDVGDGIDLSWDLTLAATPVTRLMSGVSGAVPERLWRSRKFLRAMGAVAGPVMGAGHIGLTGRVPNGQSFAARPRWMWFLRDSNAHLQGHNLGHISALPVQDRLGDFWIPQRGIFMIGSSSFEPFDPATHLAAGH